MLRLDAALARPAARKHGLATRAQARNLGLSDDAIDDRLRVGLLTTPQRGVLHHAAAPFTERSRLLAVVLAAGPTAVASHRSAATLHRFDRIRRFRPEVTVRDTTKPKVQAATVHRTDTLDAVDVCVVDDIPCTAPARTLLDLGAVVPFEVVEHAVQVAVIEKTVTEVDLLAVLERLGKPGRRGTRPLRAVVRQSMPDERLASILERDLLRIIAAAGLPTPELQYGLACADGTVAVLDFAWPVLRLAVEADGHRWHATRAQLERDHQRRRSIQASGWHHYSYGFGDVHDRAVASIAQLHALFVALTGGSPAKATKS